MRDRSLDLLGAILLALATASAVWFGAPVAATAVLGIPLVLLAPGYVWTDVLFGSRLRPELRVALSLALSLPVTAVGGVLLYAVGVPLERSSWLIMLAALTVVGATVAATLRTPMLRVQTGLGGRPPRSVRRRVPLGTAIRLGLAAMVAATAIGVAVYSASAQVEPAFTQLSLNQNQHGSAPATAQIALGNREQQRQIYRIVVKTDRVVSNGWTVTLADGANWQHSVPALPGHHVAVDVYKNASSGPPYRHVAINLPAVGKK